VVVGSGVGLEDGSVVREGMTVKISEEVIIDDSLWIFNKV
jgi:hypothetical protein